MAEKTISALVEGGKASPGPPLGPTLGPMGISAANVVKEINEKTKSFVGMTVPVTVLVDTETKEFKITVGTPPISALIKKQIGVEKASGKAKEIKIADMLIDEIIEIAKSKQDALHAKDLHRGVKEVLGTCLAMGVTVEGKDPRDVQKEVSEGKYDEKITGKTPLKNLTPEEQKTRAEKAKKATEKKEEAPPKKKAN